MSTILDALRKAQAKQDEDDADDAQEVVARDAAGAPQVERAPLDVSSTFDDVAPTDRITASAKRPNVLAAVAVGLVGLALGVGAARTIAGKLMGRSQEPAVVADAKPVEHTAAKKSAKPADAPPAAEKREGRTHAARAAKESEPKAATAPSKAEDSDGPVEADAAAPAASAGLPGAPAPDGSAPPVVDGVPVAPVAAVPAPVPGAPVAAAPGEPPSAPPPVMPAPGSVAAPFGVPPAAGAASVPGAPVPPVQMAAATPPVPTAVPGEPAAGTVLETPPSGSPEVSLLFIKWSRDALNRVASLRGPGGKLLLVHEGDIVEGMRVSLIRADAVELQWRGSNFLLYAAR